MENQQKQPQLPSASLTTQLIEMGFAEQLVKQAISLHQNKQQAVNYLLSKQGTQQPIKAEEGEFEDEQQQDYKMVFVVRSDLKLALHKIAELVATAALRAYRQIEALVEVDQIKELAFYQWTEGGQKKIVVKSPAAKDLLQLAQKAKDANINFVLVEELPSNLKYQKEQAPVSKKKAKGEAKQEQSIKQQGKSQAKLQGKPEVKPQSQLEAKLQIKQQLKQQNVSSQLSSKTQQSQPQLKFQQQQPILVLGAFGPASESELDLLTKHFKLL